MLPQVIFDVAVVCWPTMTSEHSYQYWIDMMLSIIQQQYYINSKQSTALPPLHGWNIADTA